MKRTSWSELLRWQMSRSKPKTNAKSPKRSKKFRAAVRFGTNLEKEFMKLRNKEILLILVMFLLFFTVEAQKSGIEPVSLDVNVDDEIDTVINTELVNI